MLRATVLNLKILCNALVMAIDAVYYTFLENHEIIMKSQTVILVLDFFHLMNCLILDKLILNFS